MSELTIPYGPKWTTALVGLLFAGGAACAGAWLAFSPAELAKVPFLRPLGLAGAVVLMLLGALMFGVMAFCAAYLLFVAATRRRSITLTDESLVFPHGILRTKWSTIPLRSIRSVEIEPLGTRRAIRLKAASATLLIVESMLPSSEHIDLLAHALSKHQHVANRAVPVERA